MKNGKNVKQRLTISKQQQLINAARQNLSKELNAVREVFQQPSKFELGNKAIKKLNAAIGKININDHLNPQIKKVFLYERDYLNAVILYIKSSEKPQLKSLIDTVKYSTQISFGNDEQSIWEECLDFLNSLEDKTYLQAMEEEYSKLFLAKAERLFQDEDQSGWEEARKIMGRILRRFPLSPEVINFLGNNCEKVQLFNESVKKIFPLQLAKAFKKQNLKSEPKETCAADRDFERLLNFLEFLEVLEKLIRGSADSQKLIQQAQNLITNSMESLKVLPDTRFLELEELLKSLQTLHELNTELEKTNTTLSNLLVDKNGSFEKQVGRPKELSSNNDIIQRNDSVQQLEALLKAIQNNELNSIHALLKQVYINVRHPQTQITALHQAAIHSHNDVVKEVIEILFAAGADPKLQWYGETPSECAKSNDRPDVAELIEQAELNRIKKKDQTVLNKPVKILNRKGLANISPEQLIAVLKLSDETRVGTAVDDGGCGFDALAQCLAGNHTEKSLRLACHKYYLNLPGEDNKKAVDAWIKKLGTNNPNVGDASYLLVQYTGEELKDPTFSIKGNSTWFTQEIDGRVLCCAMPEILPNGIHVIEITLNPESVGHYVITKDGYSQIEEEDGVKALYALPTLVVSNRHFVPLLPKEKAPLMQNYPLEIQKNHKNSNNNDIVGCYNTINNQQEKIKQQLIIIVNQVSKICFYLNIAAISPKAHTNFLAFIEHLNGYSQHIEHMAKKAVDKDAQGKEEKKGKEEIEWITIFCDYMSQHDLSTRVAVMGFGKLAKIYTENIAQITKENPPLMKGATEGKRDSAEWQLIVAALCISKMSFLIVNDTASDYAEKFRLVRNLISVCEVHGNHLLALKLSEWLLAQTLLTRTVPKDKERVGLLRKIATFYHSLGDSAYNRNLHFEASGYWRQAENRLDESEKKTALNDSSTETHRSEATREQSAVFQNERKDLASEHKDKEEKNNNIDPKGKEIESTQQAVSTTSATSISIEAHPVPQLEVLFRAILKNDLDKIRALVKQVDVNARHPITHITALHQAVVQSHNDVVKDVINILIDAGADPKLRVDGETPSDYAKANDRPDVAELIEQASLNRLKSNKQEVVSEHRRNRVSQGEVKSQSSTEGEYKDNIIRTLLQPLTSISHVVLPEQNYFCPFLPQEGAGSSQDECKNAVQKALRDALEGKTTLIVLNTTSSVDVNQPKHWTLCVVRPIQAANQITIYYIDSKGSVFDASKKGIKKEESYEIQDIGSPGDHEAHLAGSASLWLQFLQKNAVLSKWEVEAKSANHQATQATQSIKISVRVVFTGKIQQSENDPTGCGAYVVANAQDWVKEPQLETPKSYFIEALRQFHNWQLQKPRSDQEIAQYLRKHAVVNVTSSKANRVAKAVSINPLNFFINFYRSLAQTPPERKTAQHEVAKEKLPVMKFPNLYGYPNEAPFAIETVADVLQNLDLLLKEVKEAGIGYFGKERSIENDHLKTAPATVLGVRRTLEMCLGQMVYLVDEINTVVAQSPWTERVSPSQKPGFDQYAKTLLGEYSEGKFIREGLLSKINESDLKKGKLPKPVVFLFKIPSNSNNAKENESWIVGVILPAKYKTWDNLELNNEEALLFYINPKDLTQSMPEVLQKKLQEKISLKEVKATTKASALMGSSKEAPDVPLEATSALWAMYCGLMILKTGTIEFLSKVLELSPPESPELKGQKKQFVLTLHALFREVTLKPQFVTFEKRQGGSPEMIRRVQQTRKDSYYHHFKIAPHTLEPRSIKELATDIKEMQEFWDNFPQSRGQMGILISLDISENLIGKGNLEITNAGVEPLAEALRQNTTLEVLILRDCQLDDEDVQALSNALSQNHRLKCLDLSDNKITDRGGEMLLRLLGENQTLKQIKVEGNPMSLETQRDIEAVNQGPSKWIPFPPVILRLEPTTAKEKKSWQSVATLEAIQFNLEAIRIGNVGIHVVDLELCRIKAEHAISSLATNKDKQATQKVEQALNLDYSADKKQKNQKPQQREIKRELLRLVHREDGGCLNKPLVMIVQADIEIQPYSLLDPKQVQKTTGVAVVVLPQKYVTLTGKALGNEGPLIFYLNPLSENSLLQTTIKTLFMEESWDEIKGPKDEIPQITPIKLPAVFPKESKTSQAMWSEVKFKIDQPGQHNPTWGYWMFYAVVGILSTGSTEFLEWFEGNYANYEADLRKKYPQLGQNYPQLVKSLLQQSNIQEDQERIILKFAQEKNARKFAEALVRLGLGKNELNKSSSNTPEYTTILTRNDWDALQRFIGGEKVKRKTEPSWEETFNSLPLHLRPEWLFEQMKKLKEENTQLKKDVDSKAVGLQDEIEELKKENKKLKEKDNDNTIQITTLEQELKKQESRIIELEISFNNLTQIVLQNNAVPVPTNKGMDNGGASAPNDITLGNVTHITNPNSAYSQASLIANSMGQLFTSASHSTTSDDSDEDNPDNQDVLSDASTNSQSSTQTINEKGENEESPGW